MSGGSGPRPGGGLGTPEGTPDPIHKYRWAILAGCLALLAAGGGWVATRPQAATPKPAAATAAVSATASSVPLSSSLKVQPSARSVITDSVQMPVPRSGMLLEGLKEELFQLEIERQQGRISEEEYRKTKSALDRTLQRALSRSKTTPA